MTRGEKISSALTRFNPFLWAGIGGMWFDIGLNRLIKGDVAFGLLYLALIGLAVLNCRQALKARDRVVLDAE